MSSGEDSRGIRTGRTLSMVALPLVADLVPLLCRPRWPEAAISAEFRRDRTRPATRPGEPAGTTGTLLTAPGNRCRVELAESDGDRSVRLSDGLECWTIGGEGAVPGSSLVGPACDDLLFPAWLVAEFDLEVTGETLAAGRAAWVVRGDRKYDRMFRITRPMPLPAQVVVAIDKELGLLLRSEQVMKAARWSDVAEFTRLTVSDVAPGDASFQLPPDIRPAADAPAARAAAADWRQRGAYDAGDDGTSPLTDDELILLAGVRGTPVFAALISEWSDAEVLARAHRRASPAATWPPWLRRLADRPPPPSAAAKARLQMDGWRRYRVEMLTDPGRRPTTIACDGQWVWRVYADRIARWTARPPEPRLGQLVNLGWLLERHRLSADGVERVADRAGVRITAVPSGSRDGLAIGALSLTMLAADRIDVVVDSELGIALRLTWYAGGEPGLCIEMSEITTDVDPAGFSVEAPPGLPLISEPNPLSLFDLSPGFVARAAAGKARNAVGRLATSLARLGDHER